MREMGEEPSLQEAVNHAALWLRNRTVLFVWDYLWVSYESGLGYLSLLYKLMKYAPRSKMLISTRDQRIAEEITMNCETFGTLYPQEAEAQRLFGRIAFDEKHTQILNRNDIQNYLQTILEVCAGLQLALCMPGRVLRMVVKSSNNISDGF